MRIKTLHTYWLSFVFSSFVLAFDDAIDVKLSPIKQRMIDHSFPHANTIEKHAKWIANAKGNIQKTIDRITKREALKKQKECMNNCESEKGFTTLTSIIKEIEQLKKKKEKQEAYLKIRAKNHEAVTKRHEELKPFWEKREKKINMFVHKK